MDQKRKKIEEIQRKYEKKTGEKPKKKITRGHSYQEPSNQGRGRAKNAQNNELEGVGLNATKITAKKRDLTQKKGSEVNNEKVVYKSKRNIDDEHIDEKLRTQTFRFTNQFKSEEGADTGFFKEDIKDDEEIYDEFIEEEIESKSQDSPRDVKSKGKLKQNTGPQKIPSDINPFKHKRASNVDVDNGS